MKRISNRIEPSKRELHNCACAYCHNNSFLSYCSTYDQYICAGCRDEEIIHSENQVELCGDDPGETEIKRLEEIHDEEQYRKWCDIKNEEN